METKMEMLNVGPCKCIHCDFTNNSQSIMGEHYELVHARCGTCKISLPTNAHLYRHLSEFHPTPVIEPCQHCGLQFQRDSDRAGHLLDHSGGRIVQRALDGNIVRVEFANDQSMDQLDLNIFFDEKRASIMQTLEAHLQLYNSLKFNLVVDTLMRKPSADGGEVETSPSFHSVARQCLAIGDLRRQVESNNLWNRQKVKLVAKWIVTQTPAVVGISVK